ncbi:hypothetical protein [Clostridium manihotivorum]|uniref:DUF45 domain-containing protein n=1 Tax=Clostridium manihotivorum TaxID=2320868 RepID=A0A3R5V911_9CLOT|nr:hypothetical protein [Clostridium manihotivorum]QAA32951.1 hypothetical protein C1I91_15605 [Clostridium manihotivorum]
MSYDEKDLKRFLEKWQDILRLRDWDIRYVLVNKDWRKSGDIKIDAEDKKAVLLINNFNSRWPNLEELVIHELIHVKLYGMDQLIEGLIYQVFGKNEEDKKLDFAYDKFMRLLETTTEDLAKSFVSVGGEDKELSFGKLKRQINEEIGEGYEISKLQ